jgi:hypothetical protein
MIMLFQNSEITNDALQVVSSLAPAFAAGFAVQRLLEILDTWIALDRRIGAEWKKAILSALSLLVGFFLAYRLDLRVVAALGDSYFSVNLSTGLDYFVSGLIISAGTDGLNSILKFLSYSKEVKKAEVETEEETTVSARALGRLPLFSTFASIAANSFQTTNDLNADLETSLHDEMKLTWGDKFNESNWKKTPFKAYTDFIDDPKIVVREATVIVAQAFNRSVSKDTRIRLQAQVTLDTTPESILPKMRTAILFGSL